MDVSLQLRKPRKFISVSAQNEIPRRLPLSRLLIPSKTGDGIFLCQQTNNLEFSSAHANGMCHHAIISRVCWSRGNSVKRQVNWSQPLIWMDTRRADCSTSSDFPKGNFV